MLKTRIISSVIGLALLVVIMLLGPVAFGMAVLAISLVSMYEYFNSLSHAGYNPLRAVGYLACAAIIIAALGSLDHFASGYANSLNSSMVLAAIIYLVIAAAFTQAIFMHDKYSFVDAGLTILGILYIGYMFSFIILTRSLTGGMYYIYLIFIGAWATDIFAYFTGILLGRRKILPDISPKKTLEGSIGGVVGCMLAMMLYGFYLTRGDFVTGMDMYHFLILGIASGVISQIGDWSASMIKRFTHVKDYGHIMPGHGGVLDRFDSILFIAPMIYFYISFFVV